MADPTDRYNSGAYAAFKPAPDATLPRVMIGGVGAYAEIPVWRVEGHMVYTNTVPCGHMRAPGGAQPIHAMERHLDLCAKAMGIDPLELRLINAPNRIRTAPAPPKRCGGRSDRLVKAQGAGRWPRHCPRRHDE